MTGDVEACNRCGGMRSCAAGRWPAGCPGGTSPPRAYYADKDRDGFGSPDVFTSECDGSPAPDGYVENSADCCDAAAGAYPGALGFFAAKNACNSYDYNCDRNDEPGFRYTLDVCGDDAEFAWMSKDVPACGAGGTLCECKSGSSCSGQTQLCR